jgi:hypothetical protein
MSVIAIHQPNYFPWLGYFYKIYCSDIFVFLDDAQFSNEGMHNYHYIKTPQGPFRLKVPVIGAFGSSITEIRTNDALGWKERHLKTITANYKRAPYFEQVFHDIEELLMNSYSGLAEMNITLITFICNMFGFKTRFERSSVIGTGKLNEERIIEICRILGGNIYYSGTGAKKYQNDEDFASKGITLRYSDFTAFHYPQLWEGNQLNVSIIDYLMNCGYDWKRVADSQNKIKDA